jgi:SAM-dependent methyltransferase
VSDRHYFDWLTRALGRFQRESGELGAIGARPGGADLWVLAGARLDPAVELVRDALGPGARVQFLDRFERGAHVRAADLNALGDLPGDACDVLVLTRASYMIEDPGAFLADARRLLRPGGLMIVDWLHGAADLPVLDLPGHHDYDGRAYPFHTTYADAEALAEWGAEFAALLAHVNRPPAWVNLERPGAPVAMGERLRRLLGGGPRRDLDPGDYLGALRRDLARAGKRLLEPEELSAVFKVVFRAARYMYPRTRKFHLHLLTVLRPVGK